MQQSRAVNRVMDFLREGVTSQIHLLIMLLCNLTAQEAGCQDLLQLESEDLKGFNMCDPPECRDSASALACWEGHLHFWLLPFLMTWTTAQ